MHLTVSPYTLKFRERAITSRDSMTEKETWFLTIISEQLPDGEATGEIAMFRNLSKEDTPEFGKLIAETCRVAESCDTIEQLLAAIPEVSSIRFGVESALIRAGGYPLSGRQRRWLDGEEGIRINGLVWMGDKATMRSRIRSKLDEGFTCVKLKIGGISFDDELDLIASIRREFGKDDIELRLDANGAFTPQDALQRLERLARYDIHSIEQPIKPRQWEDMARICRLSPIDIALDEELIGMNTRAQKVAMIDAIKPHYIILKPSLCGGFSEADDWISVAEDAGIGWWGTSALESNIGLEALGIWTSSHQPVLPQGLGTGNLYTNNIPSPLQLRGERLWYQS
ncbi:MAG: o-succinylbenzoate synthase [Muribaculaceae bacterium]|nr:o-succinylbenzoate synthase [Muribaculaceae bacterium]